MSGLSSLTLSNSAIEAEGAAMIQGLKLAIDLNIGIVILESDCQELVNALNNEICRGNWKIYPFLNEFHKLKSSITYLKWAWRAREANHAADAAAKLGKKRLCTQVWTNGPPTSMIGFLVNVGLPCPHSCHSPN